jgi:putative FmdB family regulatory protein
MPIYEYACQDCGQQFEMLVRSDTVLACPKCQSSRLDKQLSVFATSNSSAAMSPPAAGCGGCGQVNTPGGCPMMGMH